MSATDEPPPGTDPFGPPVIPTTVGCLHCQEVYDSYRIEWRVGTDHRGRPWGFWACPTPGCDGKGFGFDIHPTDPDYRDEFGGYVYDDEPEDAAGDGADEGQGEGPPDDEPIPW